MDLWAEEIVAVQGSAGEAGNVNDDPDDVLGPSDMFDVAPECVLDDVVSGDSRFWSMGAGQASLGTEGWLVVNFGPGEWVLDGDIITVFELGAADCSHVATPRDDEYEVLVGLETIEPAALTVDDFDGPDWLPLGTTGNQGGINSFDFVAP